MENALSNAHPEKCTKNVQLRVRSTARIITTNPHHVLKTAAKGLSAYARKDILNVVRTTSAASNLLIAQIIALMSNARTMRNARKENVCARKVTNYTERNALNFVTTSNATTMKNATMTQENASTFVTT